METLRQLRRRIPPNGGPCGLCYGEDDGPDLVELADRMRLRPLLDLQAVALDLDDLARIQGRGRSRGRGRGKGRGRGR